jgi:HD-like signal output (HDOD) protein
MKEKILEKVGAFPPLDDTVNKIMAVCNDPDGSVMELAKVVESDPMTTANILKAANSPLYGFSREIKSIAQAVSIFGMETVKGFAFSSFLQKKPDLDLTPYNTNAKAFSELSQRQNAFISQWYRGQKDILDVLSLTSFLMEIGKIVLSSIVIEHNKTDDFKQAVKECKNLQELKNLEESVFGITNEEVSALILEDWNFDPAMYNSLKYLNNPENADDDIKAMTASLQAVKTIMTTSPFDKESSYEMALSIVDKYSLNKDKFIEVYEKIFEVEPA